MKLCPVLVTSSTIGPEIRIDCITTFVTKVKVSVVSGTGDNGRCQDVLDPSSSEGGDYMKYRHLVTTKSEWIWQWEGMDVKSGHVCLSLKLQRQEYKTSKYTSLVFK